jgi:hypothetical protein
LLLQPAEQRAQGSSAVGGVDDNGKRQRHSGRHRPGPGINGSHTGP